MKNKAFNEEYDSNIAVGKRSRFWLAFAFIVVAFAALTAVYFGGRYFAECSRISDTTTSERTASSYVNSLIEANDRDTTAIRITDGGEKLVLETYEPGVEKPTITCVYLENGLLYESISDPSSQGYPDSPAQVEELITCDSFEVSTHDGLIIVSCGAVSNGWAPRAASIEGATS